MSDDDDHVCADDGHCYHDEPNDRESSVCCWCGDCFQTDRPNDTCGEYAPPTELSPSRLHVRLRKAGDPMTWAERKASAEDCLCSAGRGSDPRRHGSNCTVNAAMKAIDAAVEEAVRRCEVLAEYLDDKSMSRCALKWRARAEVARSCADSIRAMLTVHDQVPGKGGER